MSRKIYKCKVLKSKKRKKTTEYLSKVCWEVLTLDVINFDLYFAFFDPFFSQFCPSNLPVCFVKMTKLISFFISKDSCHRIWQMVDIIFFCKKKVANSCLADLFANEVVMTSLFTNYTENYDILLAVQTFSLDIQSVFFYFSWLYI